MQRDGSRRVGIIRSAELSPTRFQSCPSIEKNQTQQKTHINMCIYQKFWAFLYEQTRNPPPSQQDLLWKQHIISFQYHKFATTLKSITLTEG